MIPKGCVEKCHGCKHREWSMDESLMQKYNFLKSKLNPWVEVLEPVRSINETRRWGYRTKTTLSTNFDGTEWLFGMWTRDELISIPECPIHSPNANKTLALIRNSIPKSNSYKLAFVVISGAQVVLVIKSKQLPDNSWLTHEVQSELIKLGVDGFWIHLNPSAGKRIFEKAGWYLLFGKSKSVDYNGLLYGPGAFQQLIPELYNQSLLESKMFFEPNENSAILDLYCGTGNSMKKWIDSNASVMGIELGGNAVECAKINTPNAMVLRGACRQRVPQMDSWVKNQRKLGKQLYLYANPPRTGLETEVLDWVIKDGKPSKIAYLSCSPGTLTKNLNLLTQNSYKVFRLIPFDFFPQTIHLECLALLEYRGLS